MLTVMIKMMMIMTKMARVLTMLIKMMMMIMMARVLTTLIKIEASSPTISCCCLPLSPLRSVEVFFQTNVPPMTFSHLAKYSTLASILTIKRLTMETSSRAAGSLGSCLEVHVQSCQRLLSTWQD